MTFQIKKRGRPSNADLAARAQMASKPARSDSEVLQDLQDRFGMLNILTKSALSSEIRALVVTGAPGVGKTYTVQNVLETTPDAKFDIIRGTLSAVNLYKLGYAYRRPGNVIVLDDADGIFQDEDALNILKALCDSSSTRRVHWMKESAALKEDDVPQSYEFHGTFIFISNLDFQKYVDMGGNKYVPHFEALMSRALYLDLRLHDRQAISLWVNHVATAGKLFAREEVSDSLGKEILDFVHKHRDDLRELSLRTLVKLIGLAKGNQNWQHMGKILLCRD